MNYRTRFFRLEELVSPQCIEARGDKAWELLDPRLLQSADKLREEFGPLTVNDWHRGGTFKESGLREFSSATGAPLSQHKFGRALDIRSKFHSPADMLEFIQRNPFEFPHITTIEDVNFTPTWLHIDVRNNDLNAVGVRVIRP